MAIRDNPLAYNVLGCAMRVHATLGPGFLERVYGDALAIELDEGHIPFARETSIPVCYHGQQLGEPYRADFLCDKTLIVELKAVRALSDIERAQTLNYLKATGVPAALLINFARKALQYEYLTPRPHWSSSRDPLSTET